MNTAIRKLLTFSALVSGFTVPAETAASYPVQVIRNVAYGPLPAHKLDICLPLNKPGTTPAFVLIHGGGFWTGDKSEGFTPRACQLLASQGFVAININYRLVSPLNVFPDPLVDAQLAVRWLRASAAAFKVEKSQICSVGVSAGGNLAVFLGVKRTIYPGDQAHLYRAESPAANCVIDIAGSTDFTIPTTPQFDLRRAKDMVGSDRPDRLAAASPGLMVDPYSAPMSIIHGRRDPVVSFEHAVRLRDALARNRVSFQFQPHEGGHVFEGLSPLQKETLFSRSVSWVLDRINYQAAPPATSLIIRALHSSAYLIPDSIHNGALLRQGYAGKGSASMNERWSLVRITGDSYQIYSESSRKCMDVRGASLANGAQIQQWDCLGRQQTNQLFQLRAVGNGMFQLVAAHSGKCVDLGGSWLDGATAQQQDCIRGNLKGSQFFSFANAP